MKMNLLLVAGAAIFLSTAMLSGCTQKTSQATATATNNPQHYHLFKMVPKAEHEKMFPNGHKDGRECYFDKELNAYFCQYWSKYEGYAPK